MNITKPAIHRVQNLGLQMALLRSKDQLQGDVSTYK